MPVTITILANLIKQIKRIRRINTYEFLIIVNQSILIHRAKNYILEN